MPDERFIEITLLKIIRSELEKCEKNKIAPSSDVLDTINTLVNFRNCC